MTLNKSSPFWRLQLAASSAVATAAAAAVDDDYDDDELKRSSRGSDAFHSFV